MSASRQSIANPGALADLARALRAGDTDPVRLLDACLVRIDAVEPQVLGFRVIDRDGARAQAQERASEAKAGAWRSALHGIPVAIKDVIDVAGLPTRAGSRTREAIAPSPIDAWVTAQVRAAGAVIVGKAHTTEFAYFDGPPPTRNPHNLAHTPGGSSGGPAAVVAAGMVPLSVGTQTAGSVSRPAAYCGIAAFKPSTLAWPAFGIVPFAPSFDTPGVFAYRVADAVAAARVLTPAFLRCAHADNAREDVLRIGLIEDPIIDFATNAVRTSLRTAGEKLAACGARIDAIRAPVGFGDLLAWHKTVTEFELGRAHGALLGAPSGDVTPALREAIERGRAITSEAYADAAHALDRARTQFWTAFAATDALLFPAAPDVAPPGMKTGDPRFIIPFTALGGPLVSIPVAFEQGLPLGLMLAGAPGTDMRLATIAERIALSIEIPR